MANLKNTIISGSTAITGSWNLVGNLTVNGNVQITGSVNITGSLLLNGSTPGGTAASLSISASSLTPAYSSSLTITATPTGITPTSYTFTYVNDVNGNRTSVTQVSNVLSWTAVWNGAQTITATATDGVTSIAGSVSVTVQNGMRVPTWILNTAPPASATGAVRQVGDFFGFDNNGGNNGNCYAAGMTGACGIVWQPIGVLSYQFIGFAPNITYASNQNQTLDPTWDWQFGGPFGNIQLYIQDNGGYINPIILTYNLYWFRMDRASNGTIRLYRGTSPDACNTLVHTYSLTNTGTLYPKFYDLSGMRVSRAYIYGS